jgi:hypothetical protein
VGPIGLLLSTPLTVCLVVLGQHVPQLGFLDVLFGSEPVLTPAETLYQRLLAGDPDEATERVEDYLDEHSSRISSRPSRSRRWPWPRTTAAGEFSTRTGARGSRKAS